MAAQIVEPKRGANVGRVVVEVLVQNYSDLERAERGEIPREQVRQVTVEALVDSGATYFCLPKSQIDQLGLHFRRTKETRTIVGPLNLDIYGAVELATGGRACITEVLALPEGRQPLLGQIPLEMMDWWVDVTNHRLVGNPEHGGQWMAEVF